jgi:predicted nuclease with TOPRIM domain
VKKKEIEMEVKGKEDQTNDGESEVKWVAELEASHAGLRGRSRELEATVGALDKLLSNIMSTDRELKLKLDEVFTELDVARKMEARLAAAESHPSVTLVTLLTMSNRAKGEVTQAHALASTYRHHIDWVIDSGASKHVTRESHSFTTYSICSPENYPNC